MKNRKCSCHICGKKTVKVLVDFGKQPVCNRFLKNNTAKERFYPLMLGQCDWCGLIQNPHPLPASKLQPLYKWITYSEPEKHLKVLANTLINLPDINKQSVIGGVSFKDDSLLQLMRQKGVKKIWRINRHDLNLRNPLAGIETIQKKLTPKTAEKISAKYGKSDIIIARHFLEHTASFTKSLEALKQLITPKGYIVMEVPDCQRAIKQCDYTTVWEEHMLYFTSSTFKNSFSFAGCSLIEFKKFPYPLENVLVGIVQPSKDTQPRLLSKITLEKEKAQIQAYSGNFSEKRKKLKLFLTAYKKNKGDIAILGAGHFACAFINFMQIKKIIGFIADDNPQKQGLFMPGSKIPINGSPSLLEKNIKLCLLSVDPHKEDKILKNNMSFIKNGGEFLSIFPASQRSLAQFLT